VPLVPPRRTPLDRTGPAIIDRGYRAGEKRRPTLAMDANTIGRGVGDIGRMSAAPGEIQTSMFDGRHASSPASARFCAPGT